MQIARRIRTLARTPWYAVTAVTCIAVGLALSTATFAFVDATLHPSVPYDAPDRLFSTELRLGNQKSPPTVTEQARLLSALPSVEAVGVSMYRREVVALSNQNRSRGVSAFGMSPDLFKLLGVKLVHGRFPLADESREGRVALVNEQVWKSEFPGRDQLSGERIRVGDREYEIVGVLPAKATAASGQGVWIPFNGPAATDTLRVSFYAGSSKIFVRLRAGETQLSAQPDLDRLATDLSRTYVTAGAPQYRMLLRTLSPQIRRGDELTVLLYVVAFGILAIACLNVTALTLARGLTRRRDYAVRRALGASATSIGTEVFSEVAVVTGVGTIIGIGLTFAVLGLFASIIPLELTWSWFEAPRMNWRTISFVAFSIAVSTAVAGGLPAWRASRVSPSDPLKDNAGTTTGRSRAEFRALVIAELSVATVLLMMGSLVSLSAKNMLNFEFGFNADRMLHAGVNLPVRASSVAGIRPDGTPYFKAGSAAHNADTRPIRDRALEVIQSTPGVIAAAQMVSGRPADDRTVVSDRTAAGEPSLPLRGVFTAGNGFFTTLGVDLIQGRDFQGGDAATGGAAVISERAAQVLFPRGDAIGRRIKVGSVERPGTWATVVGISRDFQLAMSPDPDLLDPPVFFAASDTVSRYMTFAVRIQGNDIAIVRALQERLRSAMPPEARVFAQTWMANYDYQFRVQAFFTKVFGSLGLAALALSALGLFSVLSYAVNQRSREFAVRTSLGATPGRLISHVMRSAAELALGGTAIGALLSFWASAGVSGFLFGVKNTDPVSLVITEVTLIVVCLLAALAPALRASRANPLDIIRAV
jgi:putative ABC transport system permease protein